MALKIIQSVFLLLAIAGSACAEWTRVGGNELFRAYVDASSIVGIGNLVTISTLNDYSTLQTTTDGPAYMSSVVWFEFDCVWRWRRQLTATNFSGAMGSGSAVFPTMGRGSRLVLLSEAQLTKRNGRLPVAYIKGATQSNKCDSQPHGISWRKTRQRCGS